MPVASCLVDRVVPYTSIKSMFLLVATRTPYFLTSNHYMPDLEIVGPLPDATNDW